MCLSFFKGFLGSLAIQMEFSDEYSQFTIQPIIIFILNTSD